jgi:hypothetical protein
MLPLRKFRSPHLPPARRPVTGPLREAAVGKHHAIADLGPRAAILLRNVARRFGRGYIVVGTASPRNRVREEFVAGRN